MQGTRLERDADLIENELTITELRTSLNTNEINCGLCNKIFFSDNSTFQAISRAIEEGLDNPFICDGCRAEYDDLATQR
jgi:uncharacterized protein YlaI